MTRRWMVGIDGSETAIDAMHWAARNAVGRDVEIAAVSAFHVPAIMAVFTARRGFGVDEIGLAATAAHDIDVAIERVGGDVEPGAVTVQPIVEEGEPAHVLVDGAADADLLVVGRRGTGGLRDHALGSVSRYCATHSPAPVVVVPAGWSTPATGSLVVGFDGSDHAKSAVRWALDFADAKTGGDTGVTAVDVTVITAIDVAPWLDPGLTRERYPDEVAAQEQRLRAALDDVDPDGRATHSIVLESPRQALAEASASTDLIVVGARGRGGAAAGLLGSVSTWMLQGAIVPVVVVPPLQ